MHQPLSPQQHTPSNTCTSMRNTDLIRHAHGRVVKEVFLLLRVYKLFISLLPPLQVTFGQNVSPLQSCVLALRCGVRSVVRAGRKVCWWQRSSAGCMCTARGLHFQTFFVCAARLTLKLAMYKNVRVMPRPDANGCTSTAAVSEVGGLAPKARLAGAASASRTAMHCNDTFAARLAALR